MKHYKEAGNRVLIVANHSSLLDGILLYAWLPETPTFAINTKVADKLSFRFYLRFVDLFVMDPSNPLSVKSMINFIRENRRAVIFPEGRITTTGILMKIYEGPGLVADKTNAMVLPIAIDGAQRSPFSYMHGRGRTIWFPEITITVLAPEKISIAEEIKGHSRRKAAATAMQTLMYKLHFMTYDCNRSLFKAFLDASVTYGRQQVIIEDLNYQPLNYRQFITRTFILAKLLKKDTKPSESVGLLLPNINTTVICFMALQYLGRVTAMLNFTSGTRAILRACEIGNIKNVYTSRKFIENAKLENLEGELKKHINLIYLEDLSSKISLKDKISAVLSSINPATYYRKQTPNVLPDSPAVILFTSGSEGSPKGVVLSHKNILSNFAQVRCHIPFTPSDIVFSCLPYFHTFGLTAGCIMPLLGGSKIFVYPTPLHYRIIPELIYEMGATILFGTNTFFKGYAKHAHPYDFHSLHCVVAGAEKLRDDTRLMWMNKFGVRIYEGYGVTETSPVISVNTPVVNKQNTTGQILPGMDSYIEPVEGISSGGKLIVRGPNVMLGYLPQESHGDIKSPSTERGANWYDTGDIASVDDEGFISILGRAKRFAKIGGEMISLTAVEQLAMDTWPGFNHAAVNLLDERKGEKIILVTDNRQATKKQIQEKARELQFGELYIPKKVVLAEEMPVLSTGKINYVTLTALTMAEDKEGSGWITKITNLMKKTEQEKLPIKPVDEQGA